MGGVQARGEVRPAEAEVMAEVVLTTDHGALVEPAVAGHGAALWVGEVAASVMEEASVEETDLASAALAAAGVAPAVSVEAVLWEAHTV